MSILIADDDQKLIKILKGALHKSQHSVEVAFSAQQALEKIRKNNYELVVIDWFFAGEKLDGMDLVNVINKSQKNFPILMLSGKNTLRDKVTGLVHGADDYLTKPFHFEEFLARINALLRRRCTSKKSISKIEFGPIQLDLNSYEVICENEVLDLSNKEFQILRLMIEKEGDVVSRKELMEKVWHNGGNRFLSNTIDVHVQRVRKKLGPHEKMVVAKRGIGYRLVPSTLQLP